jgi:hypothetical protein
VMDKEWWTRRRSVVSARVPPLPPPQSTSSDAINRTALASSLSRARSPRSTPAHSFSSALKLQERPLSERGSDPKASRLPVPWINSLLIRTAVPCRAVPADRPGFHIPADPNHPVLFSSTMGEPAHHELVCLAPTPLVVPSASWVRPFSGHIQPRKMLKFGLRDPDFRL